jgi:hypothetical protein
VTERHDLTLMVGEIHSDVKKLLEQDREYGKRIHSLERTRWYAGGFIAAGVAYVAMKFGVPIPFA